MTRVLALDVGTTAVKAGIVADGDVAEVAEAPLTLATPEPGWAEQDPDDWWSAVADAVGRLSVGAVDAISVTGQMQDLIPLGRDGRPLRPAILYSDGRAVAEHDELADRLGPAWPEAVGPVDATNVAAKWAWLQQHEPAAAGATEVVLLGAHSVVVDRLCDVRGCDPTTAATTGLYDVAEGRWWAPVVEALGLSLPEPVSPTEPVGVGGSALGLGDVPIFHANGDAVATTLGIVGSGTGRPYAYLGTSGWVATVRATPAHGAIALPVGDGRVVSIGPLPTASGAVDWARSALLGDLTAVELDGLVTGVCAAAEGVVFLPHLDGVRLPHADPHATGVLLGVRRSTGRAVVAAAVLEGVAHSLRAIGAVVAPDADQLLLCGGGARSAWWPQVLADVCGVEVAVVDDEHAGLRGAAAAAHVGLGVEPPDALGTQRRLTPDPARRRAHADLGGLFDRLVPTMSPTMAELAELRGSGPST